MIVVLANPFEGGALVVRHGVVQSRSCDFEEARVGKAPCYAAFYADCEHEVQRVTRGSPALPGLQPGAETETREAVRRRGTGRSRRRADARRSRSWVATQPAKPLVFALEHHYTQRGLSLDLLKGADRQLAELVVPAADRRRIASCIWRRLHAI